MKRGYAIDLEEVRTTDDSVLEAKIQELVNKNEPNLQNKIMELNLKENLHDILQLFNYDGYGNIIPPDDTWYQKVKQQLAFAGPKLGSIINVMEMLGYSDADVNAVAKWSEYYLYYYGDRAGDEESFKSLYTPEFFRTFNTLKIAPSEDITKDDELRGNEDDLKKEWAGRVIGQTIRDIYNDPESRAKYEYKPPASSVSDNIISNINDFSNGVYTGFTHGAGLITTAITGGDVTKYINDINTPGTKEANDPLGLGQATKNTLDAGGSIINGVKDGLKDITGINLDLVIYAAIAIVGVMAFNQVKQAVT